VSEGLLVEIKGFRVIPLPRPAPAAELETAGVITSRDVLVSEGVSELRGIQAVRFPRPDVVELACIVLSGFRSLLILFDR
jgi:hypothetical protein